jgi:hypothetical protein
MSRKPRTLPVAAVAVAVAVAGLVGCRPDPQPGDGSAASRTPRPTGSADAPASPGPSSSVTASGKRSLVDAAVAGGLRKHTGDNAVSDIPVDPGEMRDGMNLVVSHFEAPDGISGPILFEGVDNVPEDPNKRREHLFRGMLEHIQWDPELGQPTAAPVDAGPLGGSVECLLASLSQDGDVICGWADTSTAAVAWFKDTTVSEAGKIFVRMRSDLEK